MPRPQRNSVEVRDLHASVKSQVKPKTLLKGLEDVAGAAAVAVADVAGAAAEAAAEAGAASTGTVVETAAAASGFKPPTVDAGGANTQSGGENAQKGGGVGTQSAKAVAAFLEDVGDVGGLAAENAEAVASFVAEAADSGAASGAFNGHYWTKY